MSTLAQRGEALQQICDGIAEKLAAGEPAPISFTALGILGHLAAVDDDFQPSIEGYLDGPNDFMEIIGAIDELVKGGYIVRTVLDRDEVGRPTREQWTVFGRTLGGAQ
jgi:hypothetical protein